MKKPNKVRELLAAAEQRLQAISSARLDAEILLATSMRAERSSLYAFPEREVPEDIATSFELLVTRRMENYPVAYLCGNREFWSLELKVNQHTLIPRPETECLVETAIEFIPETGPCKILDLGTGSGAIALSIARERPGAKIVAADLSPDALAVSIENASLHKIENIRFVESDWFSELEGMQFEIIVSNPPYVESDDSGFTEGEIRFEPRLALDGGHNGLQAIGHIVPAAVNFLKPGGRLLLEHGYQQAQAIRQLFADNRYTDITSRQDYAGLDRISFAQWP